MSLRFPQRRVFISFAAQKKILHRRKLQRKKWPTGIFRSEKPANFVSYRTQDNFFLTLKNKTHCALTLF